ncbi:hypothetical protein [Effusibacillus lacus]|uniref:Uncharacterized protein n=1 Tax=Effusibacillus lacus TaxID=1348429 RepID=A0A292YMT5_9BACL|nr:hypothetical protein [Effusibacillus lacus]TCS76480.1 hypothetical protein EDD64_10224 [Effusibacillus lacus]GAX90496.1 hypothetical protein EFBL_2123 [Effusibacillus lacus]
MGFFLGLVKFVKVILLIAICLLFLRAILFPNALDIIILMMLSFVLFLMLISRP